ncbi:TonB-dependent siderophore receptor [Acinetobacter nectaris]|uniref:TonB-dependent siderophore receptor n=1 Tax=Acinetobacter nectaris TaxID=1219382 RepID=UPI001EFFA65D|nr:TonB-dependent siderophore receptor [Acinetobacter nectaris]MCF9045821.1 TonB-dependent siderophore receptor [Acinetobacter nectaris]
MIQTRYNILYFSIISSIFLSASSVYANPNNAQNLPTIQLKSDNQEGYVAKKAASGLKSDTPLFETAQSVSVITNEQLDQKQASTLVDAIADIAGVSAGYRSRRGLDDIIIRGQNASNQIYVDGLRQGLGTGSSSDAAIDLSGIDQVQVIKGPASVNFGQVAPGGIVNLVSKWPQANTFANADLTYGSYSFKQGKFDLNYSPNNTEKGAFRLAGRIADQKDEIDKLYFKNIFISPSYTFNLGDKADLSLIASYQHREYLRIQGIPILGSSLKENPNGPFKRSIYLGEPSAEPYKVDAYRLGYKFKYNFDNDWNFEQNFAIKKSNIDGNFITMDRWADKKYQSIIRTSDLQSIDTSSLSIDNQLKKTFNFQNIDHHILIGADGLSDRRTVDTYNCKIDDFNFYNPVYNTKVDCSDKNYKSSLINNVQKNAYVGLYARDQIVVKDNLILNFAGRSDWGQTSTTNLLKSQEVKNHYQAFTGSVSALYNINNWVAPYTSYSTSFLPVAGTDRFGNAFEPQKGKQLETGLKFQNESQNVQASLAWYNLTLENVPVTDPVNSKFKSQDGEQNTKGIEAEIAANISDQLRLNASFSHMYDAKISKDTNIKKIGQRLENTPENTYSLSMRYYPVNELSGWYIGTGVRGESSKQIRNESFRVPSFVLFDAEAGYEAQHWGAQLSIRNMFDKEYYAGVIDNIDNNNRVITLGNPRQINFTLKFKY